MSESTQVIFSMIGEICLYIVFWVSMLAYLVAAILALVIMIDQMKERMRIKKIIKEREKSPVYTLIINHSPSGEGDTRPTAEELSMAISQLYEYARREGKL